MPSHHDFFELRAPLDLFRKVEDGLRAQDDAERVARGVPPCQRREALLAR